MLLTIGFYLLVLGLACLTLLFARAAITYTSDQMTAGTSNANSTTDCIKPPPLYNPYAPYQPISQGFPCPIPTPTLEDACGQVLLRCFVGLELQILWFSILCVGSAALLLWTAFPRSTKVDVAGLRIDLSSQPRLVSFVDEVARATGQSLPAEMRITPLVNAQVQVTGGIMGFGGRRILLLGLPLLQSLTTSELRAVLAHEFGHYVGQDTVFLRWAFAMHQSILRTLDHVLMLERLKFDPSGLTLAIALPRLPLVAYGLAFLRITASVSRMQERIADQTATRIAGADRLISALRRIRAASNAYKEYERAVLAPMLETGVRPSLISGFQQFMDSDRGLAILADADQRHDATVRRSPYASHPSIEERITRLHELAGGVPSLNADGHTDPLAIDYISDREQLDAAVVTSIWTVEQDSLSASNSKT